MVRRHILHGSLLVACFTVCFASFTIAQSSPVAAPKEVKAFKITNQPPNLDGRLDDPVWQSATWSSGFVQRDPNEGRPAMHKTEVAVAFDGSNLYVAARLYTPDPTALANNLDRRDRQGSKAEQFAVFLDSYHNKRTAYGFGVNVSGVRFDFFQPQDQEFNRDYTFDPVWHAHTGKAEGCWTVEMVIPFSQLRFNRTDDATWGINFKRAIPETQETDYWILVPKQETGWASRFGVLTGMEGIEPSRRVELIPYAASDASVRDGNFSGNPFTDGEDIDGRVGADLKVGLGPSLTLSATFNPDFGQVEADPAQVNLSAAEIFYDEKRPFFTEGSQMISGPDVGGYYYSRRIGSAPRGFAYDQFMDQPISTTILGAAKVTGQTAGGLSVGIMSAITDKETARLGHLVTDTLGNPVSTQTYAETVEPLASYNAVRLLQQFGPNQSTVGVMFTGVFRDLDKGTPLDDQLRRSAIAGGADWNLRFNGGTYELAGMFGASRVTGSETAIARTQRSYLRYFQRPDAGWVTYDPTRTSLSGARGYLRFSKLSGKHWTYSITSTTKTSGFELNDLGSQGTADDINLYVNATYRENSPGPLFRNYSLFLGSDNTWNYGGFRQFCDVGASFNYQLKSFWNGWLEMWHQISGQDDGKTRGGPSMANEPGLSVNTGIESPGGSMLSWGGNTHYGMDVLDGWVYGASTWMTARPGNRWEFTLEPFYNRESQPRQYVTTVARFATEADAAATYGSRYIFSRISRSTFGLQMRMNYFFTPDLSLELYAEPYASGGTYYQFGELAAANGNDLITYDDIVRVGDSGYYRVPSRQQDDGNGSPTELKLPIPDFGYRSFRSNMVLRWEFNPGSTLYVVWSRNMEGSEEVGRRVRPGSLFDGLSADGTDYFAVKLSYWIPLS